MDAYKSEKTDSELVLSLRVLMLMIRILVKDSNRDSLESCLRWIRVGTDE